jgi:hypothetical protein
MAPYIYNMWIACSFRDRNLSVIYTNPFSFSHTESACYINYLFYCGCLCSDVSCGDVTELMICGPPCWKSA